MRRIGLGFPPQLLLLEETMQHALSRIPRQSFGVLLKHEREREGLAHRDIGVRCGVDKDTVRAWEADAVVPSRLELKKLFGSLRKLRHFVHLLPEANEAGMTLQEAMAALEDPT